MTFGFIWSNDRAQARRADRNRIEQKRSTGVALQRAFSMRRTLSLLVHPPYD